MKILIVEDEPLAAAQLAAHIAALRPNAKILAVCDTIRSVVEWTRHNTMPDLAFFDIQLGDGLSFDIFEQTTFNSPVIFTTAFDEYAIRAFKVNSIDYLLKPIDRTDLEKALLKFENLSQSTTSVINSTTLQQIAQNLQGPKYKERFLVKTGSRLRIIKTAEVLYFYSFQKGTFAKLGDGKEVLLDQSLEAIEALIDRQQFFRINRKYLVALKAINDVVAYSNSRLKLNVKQASENDMLVAREKVKAFKQWLEGAV